LNFKGTQSQEEHKTIFSGLKNNEMALQIKVTLQHFSISRIQQSTPIRRLFAAKF
jgi:hypothetical protein